MTADLSTAIGLGGAEPAIGGSQRGHVATKPPALQMSGSRWSTMKKGAGIYFGITLKDEGSAYAKALMRHYLLGGGSEFNPEKSSVNFPTDAMWSRFMAGRPEIQRAMESELAVLAKNAAKAGGVDGTVDASVKKVRLSELESMRWTLHGCHRIDVSASFKIEQDRAGKIVTFTALKFHWIDVGDMHPGTLTQTDSGDTVDDAEFTHAGASFPIDIPFAASGVSTWRVEGDVSTHLGGWPRPSEATSTRHRGRP